MPDALTDHPRVVRALAILSDTGWPDEWVDELTVPPDRFLVLQELHIVGERASFTAPTLADAGQAAADEMWEGWIPSTCWDLDAPAGTAPYDRLVVSGTWTATMPWDADLVEPTCDPRDGVRHALDPTRCPGDCYRCPGCPRCTAPATPTTEPTREGHHDRTDHDPA